MRAAAELLRGAAILLLLVPLCGQATEPPFVFRDVGEEAGLIPAVNGIRGHGAGWGDVDGDGWPDLFVGTFHTDHARPCMFFRNIQGKFQPGGQPALEISARTTGVVFADLDNDGDLDL